MGEGPVQPSPDRGITNHQEGSMVKQGDIVQFHAVTEG